MHSCWNTCHWKPPDAITPALERKAARRWSRLKSVLSGPSPTKMGWADVSETVLLNMDHIPDSRFVYVGDTLPQLVVTAEGGLNLRTGPSADSSIITVLEPGAFVEQTGGERTTADAGNVWVPVSEYGSDGQLHEGWVSSDFVSAHQNGDQDENGRINSELDQLGYRWVEAKTGDNMRRIAVSHSVDVTEIVILNMDHIPDPDLIYPGDRIYLPN
ncbi:MAG: LysM peptidoglycan-binding domain-containing protein [Mesorhizobium sp.]|nr:MAG: LysM peptidoglycan-binding domain-containing protein [Mesorhizobium sp.]